MSGDSLLLADYLDYVLLAEKLGFTNIFMVEHHFTGGGQVSSSLGLLTYLAAKTSRIRLGTAVIVLPWHNPAILAETVATLDVLSNGRFDFGVGKGYRPQEFSGFCIPQEEASGRFDEALAFLRSSWTETDRFSHQGKFWNFEQVQIEPRTVQKPHPPLWMGATSAESIARAAAEGVNLLLDQVAPIAEIGKRVKLYARIRDEARGDYNASQIAVTRGLFIVGSEHERLNVIDKYAKLLGSAGALKWLGGDNAEAQSQAYKVSDAPLIGTPEQIIERLADLERCGVDTVLISDMSGSKETLRTFAAEIMPAFDPRGPAKSAPVALKG